MKYIPQIPDFAAEPEIHKLLYLTGREVKVIVCSKTGYWQQREKITVSQFYFWSGIQWRNGVYVYLNLQTVNSNTNISK